MAVKATQERHAATARNHLRLLFLVIASAVFVANLTAFFSWSERRGVVDDLCYLRQAHLFQRFGLSGIRTDISRDDDRFFQRIKEEAGSRSWANPDDLGCHVQKGDKWSIQYPPGTGFLMALFPTGLQVAWLYTTCMTVVMAGTIFAVIIANFKTAIATAGVFGITALYFMVNPTKASYSMAPTVAFCVAAGLLTPFLFRPAGIRAGILIAATVGLLLGLTVSFRTANILLVLGYAVVLAVLFLHARDWLSFFKGAAFAVAYGIGLLPSLAANHVNAGSPFKTTYGAQDTGGPDFTFSIVKQYAVDPQLYLTLLTLGGLLWMAGKSHSPALAAIAISTVCNMLFFFTHSIFTQYYMMPIITLALWGLLSLWLVEGRGKLARVHPVSPDRLG